MVQGNDSDSDSPEAVEEDSDMEEDCIHTPASNLEMADDSMEQAAPLHMVQLPPQAHPVPSQVACRSVSARHTSQLCPLCSTSSSLTALGRPRLHFVKQIAVAQSMHASQHEARDKRACNVTQDPFVVHSHTAFCSSSQDACAAGECLLKSVVVL